MADEKLPSYPNAEPSLVDDNDGSPPAQVLKHANDVDEAMKAFEGHAGELLILDEATNRRLLRKIDLNILPLLCVVYGLNYLDSMASISLPLNWIDMR